MALGPLVGSVGIIAAVALLLSRETGYQRPERFVIVTSPGTRNVLWAPLPKFHDLTLKDRPIPDAQILIDGAASKCSGWACIETSNHGLEEPAGLALYQKAGGKAWLYVSDPKVGFLYRYEVTSTWRNTLEAGPQELVASNLKDAAYWLAVDGFGNIFYTDAEAGTVSMIKAEDVSKSVPQGRTVLSSEKMEKVAGPAGIATDSTALYWANLKGDRSTGTLVQARVEGSGNHSASILAGNQDMYQELEIAHARQKKVLEDQIDQFKGLRIGQALLKGTRRQSRRESVRRSFGITAGTFSITPPGFEKPDEKVLAHLAKQTNWSILDVEEVWEVFAVHAPTGRIGVQSNEFVQLLQELYRGVTDEEIMLLQQHIKAVRTRNQARSRFMRKALAGMDATQDRSDVRFSEFYVALVKWLNLQTARVEACRQADPRCSLSRYQQSAMGSAPESVPGSEATFSGGWDDYRKLKQEVDDSLRGPHQRGQGIANAVLVQKQRQSQSDQLYQLLSQDSESEDTEERNDTDEEQQDFRLTRSSTSSAGHTLDVTGFL